MTSTERSNQIRILGEATLQLPTPELARWLRGVLDDWISIGLKGAWWNPVSFLLLTTLRIRVRSVLDPLAATLGAIPPATVDQLIAMASFASTCEVVPVTPAAFRVCAHVCYGTIEELGSLLTDELHCKGEDPEFRKDSLASISTVLIGAAHAIHKDDQANELVRNWLSAAETARRGIAEERPPSQW